MILDMRAIVFVLLLSFCAFTSAQTRGSVKVRFTILDGQPSTAAVVADLIAKYNANQLNVGYNISHLLINSTGPSPTTTASATTGSPSSDAYTIVGSNYKFEPASLRVPVGTRVTWKWSGGSAHNVAESESAAANEYVGVGFRSGDVVIDATFQHTFSKPGTFYYICEPHATMGMKGEIIVTEATDPEQSASRELGPSLLLIVTTLLALFSPPKENFILKKKSRMLFFMVVMVVMGTTHVSAWSSFQNCKVMDGRPESNYRLYWNLTDTHLFVGIEANAVGWLGFGLSSDGSMNSGGNGYSDIAIGYKNANDPECINGCVYDYSTALYDTPLLDASQDLELISYSEENGVSRLEFSRPLTATEAVFDRAVSVSSNMHVLFAIQKTNKPESKTVFDMHTIPYMGSQTVNFGEPSRCPTASSIPIEISLDIHPDSFNQDFFVNQLANSLEISASRIVIEDVEKTYPAICPECTKEEVIFPRYNIPKRHTTYVCHTFQIRNDSDYHVVGFEPLKDNTQMLHHMILFVSTTVPNSQEFFPCGTMPASANPMYAWAPGSEQLIVPDTAGFPIGPGTPHLYFTLQMHYNNPTLKSDQWDASGVRLYLKPRDTTQRTDAGLVFLGVPNSRISIPAGIPEWHQSGNCEQSLTYIPLSNPIRVFAIAAHMHQLGKQSWVEHFRGGSRIGLLLNETAYDFNAQHFKPIDITIQRNDRLVTHCIWNSVGQNSTTVGGEDTFKEMCLVVLLYYPSSNVGSCIESSSTGCQWPC